MGMVRGLMAYPEAMELFGRAREALSIDLFELGLNGPEEKLGVDYYAQLAIYVTNCAYHRILEKKAFSPDMASGFSLGIFAALVAADSLTFDQGLQGVKTAALLMAETEKTEPGAMAGIIGLTEAEAGRICEEIPGVFVASVNNARQVVLSGKAEAVQKAMERSQKVGALMARRLPVGGAIHTPFMQGVSRSFAEMIGHWEIRVPRFPVMSYLRAEFLKSSEEIKDELSAQFSSPNRWYAVLQRMMKERVDHFIEVGPGNVLARMVRWINREPRSETAEEILTKGFEGSRVQGARRRDQEVGRRLSDEGPQLKARKKNRL